MGWRLVTVDDAALDKCRATGLLLDFLLVELEKELLAGIASYRDLRLRDSGHESKGISASVAIKNFPLPCLNFSGAEQDMTRHRIRVHSVWKSKQKLKLEKKPATQ